MSKIILIENQYTQFDKIRRRLVNLGFQVYPEGGESNFKDFIDLVRTFLNKRYGGIDEGSRRAKAFQEILSIFSSKKPNVIIIDNILVGYHNPENGIFLAKQLRQKDINEPIIFLTRSEQFSSDTMNNLPEITGIKYWVPKGYAGDEILDEGYLKEHLISRINEALADFHKQEIKDENKSEGEINSRGLKVNLITDERIREISQVIEAALLGKGDTYNKQIRFLLGRGFEEYLGELNTVAAPRLQLEIDLTCFNKVVRLKNGIAPLETWLRNAIYYFSLQRESAVLQEILNEVTNRLSNAPSQYDK